MVEWQLIFIISVFSELVELIERAEIKPISPRRVWGYQEIPEALKALRPGTHIGKFVISNGRDARVMVPV
jgi:D-arabinose 1-dehydrogenase-like Zn-dependent alcohol dehydrogenase